MTPEWVRACTVATLLLFACPLSAAECGGALAEGDDCAPALSMLGARNPVAEVQSFGIAGTVTRTRLEDQSSADASVLASAAHFSYETRDFFSGRSYGFGFLGAGSAGSEGGLGGELAFGLRLPFAKTHGPFARIAIEGFLMGNDAFYASMLEVPKGEFGYQHLEHELLLEGAVTAGPVLAGRFNMVGAASRSLSGLLAVGAHVAIGVRAAHLELAVNRLDSGDLGPPGAFDELRASLCGLPSVFSICTDARYQTDRANEPPGARVVYYGIRVGIVTASGPARGAPGRHRQMQR
jgi:hypothetical protein